MQTAAARGAGNEEITGQIDTSIPTGEIVFTVLGAVAELDSNAIKCCHRAAFRLRVFRRERSRHPPL